MNDVIGIDIRKRINTIHTNYILEEVITSITKASKRFGVYPYYWKLTDEQVEYIKDKYQRYIYKKYGKGKGQRIEKESKQIFNEIFAKYHKEKVSIYDKRYNNKPKNYRS